MEKINLRKELDKYITHWPWIAGCIFICLALGYVYLMYTNPVYSAKASIIIKKDSGKGGGAEGFADFGLIGGMGSGNMEEEIGILRSRRLMKDVVKALNLHIQYFKEEKVRTVELYDDLPFTLQVLKLNEEKLAAIGAINFELIKINSGYRLRNLKTEKLIDLEPGTPVDLGFAIIVISPITGLENQLSSENIMIKFSDLDKVSSHYRGRLSLVQNSNSSGLLELEIKDEVQEKARDILDQLVLEFNRSAIEDKNLIAGNTANFINDRLDIINEELDSVETGKESFKERNRLTDIQTQSNMAVQNANEYNKRQQEVATQLELSNAMLEYITSDSQMDLMPTNLGIAESGVNQHINDYNSIVLERNRVLSGSSEKNPIVVRYNRQISQIKGNIIQSLNTMRSNLQIGQEDLSRQASSIGSQIYAIPSKEREFRGIERQQNIKETLYLFLLQKREENSLSLAVTEPKAKIVDRAYSTGSIVSPNSRNIYLGTFILGLFVPISAIYLGSMLDNKVRKRSDLENLSVHIPLVGEVPRMNRKNNIIGLNDRSVLAESFRILNTNLQYLLINSKNKMKGVTILVTSSIKGEGKTFTAINLAITLANSSKKVIIIGADLRSPRVQLYVEDNKGRLGFSDYLIDDHLNYETLIQKSRLHPEVDMLTAGNIPPNPYELLKSVKVAKMLNGLKEKYDFVIIDSAPSMLVADTFLLTDYADLVLYMVRSGYTEKEILEFPLNAIEKKRFHNLSFVLNSVHSSNLGYGNKYGYGYGEEKQNFWRVRLKSPAYNA